MGGAECNFIVHFERTYIYSWKKYLYLELLFAFWERLWRKVALLELSNTCQWRDLVSRLRDISRFSRGKISSHFVFCIVSFSSRFLKIYRFGPSMIYTIHIHTSFIKNKRGDDNECVRDGEKPNATNAREADIFIHKRSLIKLSGFWTNRTITYTPTKIKGLF